MKKYLREKIYRFISLAFREEIIRDGFRGILGREPEEEALAAYRSSFKELGCEGLMNELSSSPEAWDKQKREHAEELIREAYQGVLGRDPGKEGLIAYKECFDIIGNSGLQQELSSSPEAWDKQKSDHAAELIRSLYLGILQREPDSGGLAAKIKKIRNQLSLEKVISEMLRSPEFLTNHHSHGKSTKESPWDEFLEEISEYREYYAHSYGNAPEKEEIAAFIVSEKKIRDLKREGLAQKLKSPDSLKVLLIGAYGNGNLGDAYQALALEGQIRERYSIPEANIYAASYNAVSTFPYAADRIVSREQLMDPEFVNSFGMILIGGGGLFAHPHAPFRDMDNWAKGIHAPIIIHAVGATREIVAKCGVLVKKAVEVSGRDEESLSTLMEFHDDCKHQPDPIFACSFIEALEQYDTSSLDMNEGESWNCLWILKYPANDQDRKVLEMIQAIITENYQGMHVIAAIEPEMDRILETWFPGKVQYCASLKDLNRLIRQSEKV